MGFSKRGAAILSTDQLVAQLTHDHLDKCKGNVLFSYIGLLRYFSGDVPTETSLEDLPNTRFRLYDDDNILYYSGWLKNDTEALVQQFVLAWAMADSGCTIIKINHPISNTWIQEIG